jgi:peptidoglycan-associated lipoprotein
MKKHVHLIVIAVLASLLAACAKDASQTPTVDEQGTAAETAPAGGAKSADGTELGTKGKGSDQMASEMRIYFALDSSSLDEQSRPIVEAHASRLAANPSASVTLEGHADERGTREYNLALGERRAQSVQKLMLALGAASKQVKIVSYGEEKPADRGHDESAYRQNRRVEIVYGK